MRSNSCGRSRSFLNAGAPDHTPYESASGDKRSGRGTRSADGSTHLEAGPPAELNSAEPAGRDAVPPVLRGGRGAGVGRGGRQGSLMRGAATVASLRCNSPARLLLLPVEAGYWQPACGAIGASKRVGDFSRQLEGGEHFGGRAFWESFVVPFLTEPLTDLGSRLKAQGWLPARARRASVRPAGRSESGNTLHALQLFRFLPV